MLSHQFFFCPPCITGMIALVIVLPLRSVCHFSNFFEKSISKLTSLLFSSCRLGSFSYCVGFAICCSSCSNQVCSIVSSNYLFCCERGWERVNPLLRQRWCDCLSPSLFHNKTNNWRKQWN